MILEDDIKKFLYDALRIEKNSIDKNPNRGHKEKEETKRDIYRLLDKQVKNIMKG